MNIFIWAAAHGATDAVRLLLRCAGYNTPLFCACASGNREMAELLLQDPPVDPNAPIMERVGWGAPRLNRHFHAAVANGHEGVVQLLLSDQRRNGEESEALIEASHHGHLNIVDLLLKDSRASASWVDSEC
ncbi:ankyrin repeat-containing domain protein [Chytriomyces cf. hyalinus JEL632]|nr:ankyrin repeat-containing domain protein [Chytriomyces cf. hyalinus JEL632]